MKFFPLLLAIFILLFFISCEKDAIRKYPSYNKLEKQIKEKHDFKATWTFEEYEKILLELSKDKYACLTVNDFNDSVNLDKVMVCMRHDVDCHPFKALDMAILEEQYNISTTYYILATSSYYGTITKKRTVRHGCLNSIYQQIYNLHHEIGIHNDLMAIMIQFQRDPYEFNNEEIAYYNSLGIEIYGTAAHGSDIGVATGGNYQIFSNFCESTTITYNNVDYNIGKYSLKEFGFDYEAYHIDFNKYYSDCGGKWNFNEGIDGLLQRLEDSNPGDRIQILTHPVWWGK